jgi:cell division protein FtsQ
MKPTRKNRLKKNKQVRRAVWRQRTAFTAKTLLGLLVLAVVSAGFILVYDYFTQTPHFQARRIDVSGLQRLTQTQVLDIAGIGQRTNILSVNLVAARKRLLAQPWIAAATISREIPSVISIDIREETPLARLEMPGGQDFLINVAGEVFKRDNDPDSHGLPRVQGLNHGDLPVPGQPPSRAFSAVMALLRLAGEKDNPLPLASIRRIRMDREIGATVYTGEDDRVVKLGFGDYREKCAALGHLMARLDRDSRLVRYRIIDLFDVNRVVLSLAPADPAMSDYGSDHGSDHEEV